jgi:iron only hydrogenase large subunit-like protein
LNSTGRAIFTAKDKDIYHVTVMPCFDKKLEAARQEFQIESNGRIVKAGLDNLSTKKQARGQAFYS